MKHDIYYVYVTLYRHGNTEYQARCNNNPFQVLDLIGTWNNPDSITDFMTTVLLQNLLCKNKIFQSQSDIE